MVIVSYQLLGSGFELQRKIAGGKECVLEPECAHFLRKETSR
jgi:hypothetical protein